MTEGEVTRNSLTDDVGVILSCLDNGGNDVTHDVDVPVDACRQPLFELTWKQGASRREHEGTRRECYGHAQANPEATHGAFWGLLSSSWASSAKTVESLA